MNSLSFETFIGPDPDLEKRRYLVLGGLKEYKTEFNKKKVYPSLGELIKLLAALEETMKQRNQLHFTFPKEIKRYDLENKKVVYESKEDLPPKIEIIFELIEWAIPLIKDAIEEGIVLYDFVEKNLNVENVGLLPIYKDEGYFLIPDLTVDQMQIHLFEISLFNSDKEKFRSLKTKLVDTIELLQTLTPEAIKLELIRKRKELPNPATYFCETDLDFPFSETIFPIAKRKLMSRVSS
jgi:hypothetical protein